MTDIFNQIMEEDGISFPEAVLKAAEMKGLVQLKVPIPLEDWQKLVKDAYDRGRKDERKLWQAGAE